MELQGEAVIQRILSLVGDLVMVDNCMAEQYRLGFAQTNVKIDLARSLRPGMLEKGPKGPF